MLLLRLEISKGEIREKMSDKRADAAKSSDVSPAVASDCLTDSRAEDQEAIGLQSVWRKHSTENAGR